LKKLWVLVTEERIYRNKRIFNIFSCVLTETGIILPHRKTIMTASIEFDATKYPPATLQLIMQKAEEWKCTPSEAVVRLLNDLAKRRTRKTAA
jgi:hypothetical protein